MDQNSEIRNIKHKLLFSKSLRSQYFLDGNKYLKIKMSKDIDNFTNSKRNLQLQLNLSELNSKYRIMPDTKFALN